MRFRSIALLVLALAVVSSAIVLRRSRPAPSVPEGDVALPAPSAAPSAPITDSLPLPADVQATLDRSFGGAVGADPRARPAFLAGDFNGDGVTDLALAVRPRDAAALVTLNAGAAPFRLQDATAARDRAPDAGRRVEPGEPLLGVVHGVAGMPWRAPAERQAYLVRHAVGVRMRTRPLAAVPDAVRMQVARAHVGDVIALDRDGRAGLILWTGGAYAWFDLSAGGGSGLP
jgi:hypothetical protein